MAQPGGPLLLDGKDSGLRQKLVMVLVNTVIPAAIK